MEEKDWIPDQVGDDNYLKPKVIAIVGPTACGKTGIGVRLAKEFGGEIVSADSRQVFRRLDIGTGKDLKEYGDIPYHMIDIVEPGEKMTLFDYLPLARKAIDDILSRGKLPIIVGGTGLYVQGLIEGFELQRVVILNEVKNPKTQRSFATTQRVPFGAQDDKLDREQLDNLTIEQLNHILEKLDPEKYQTIDRKNRHRLIRAIELAQEGLRPTKVKPDFEVLQIGVDLPRAELFSRIDKRVDEWFEAGLLEEVAGLLDSGISAEWLMQLGLEYKGVTQFLLNCHFERSEKSHVRKDLSPRSAHLAGLRRAQSSRGLAMARDDKSEEFQAMSQDLKWKTHQFARRQLTWLRRFPEINWLSDYKEMERFAKIFLSH